MNRSTGGIGVFFLVCLVFGSVLGGISSAETSIKPLEIEDAVWALDFRVQGVVAAFSPDGEWVASTVCDPRRRIAEEDEEDDSTGGWTDLLVGCDIWLTATTGGASNNLTNGEGNNWGPSWSPDGKLLAFTSDRDGEARVWIWDRSTGGIRRVSDAVTRNFFGMFVPVWRPGAREMVVKLHPEGYSKEDLEPKHGGAGRTEDAEPGSTVVVFRSPPLEPDPARGGESAEPAFLPHLICDLGIIDVAAGEVRRLASGVRYLGGRHSPDGTKIAFLEGRRGPSADFVGITSSLMVLDLESGQSRELVSDVLRGFGGASVRWSPDGKWVAYIAKTPSEQRTEHFTSPVGDSGDGDLFIVAAEGGEPRSFEGVAEGSVEADDLAPLWDAESRHIFAVGGGRVLRADLAEGRIEPLGGEAGFEVRALVQHVGGNQVWSPGGGRSVIVMTREKETKQDGFASIDLENGDTRQLLVENREYSYRYGGPVTSPDGSHVVYVAKSSRESPDLWIARPNFAAPRRLTTLNPQLDGYTFGEGRLIHFKSDDGEDLRAALLLPAGYEDGKRYPTVVWVYASDSGSRAVHRFGLVGYPAYNMHMFTTRGYAVMWPDIPTRLGTPMQDLMKAVMPVIDRAVELGITDPDRLAVMGQSGGGFSTLALIVQTRRFKAAVMNAGYGDQIGMYGQMSYDGSGAWIPWLERLGGSMGVPPWEAPLRYVQNSPIFYLDRIETPLIVQAGGDDEVIVPLSDQVWVGLQRLGKEAVYLRYEGEGHVLNKAANLKDYWTRVLAFFDEHVKRAGEAGPTPEDQQ